MDTREALGVLGLGPGATPDEVRASYLRLIRHRHPDVTGGGPDDTGRTAELTQAYAAVRAAMGAGGALLGPSPDQDRGPGRGPPSGPGGRPPGPTDPLLRVEATDGATITIEGPPGEAFAALFEAAGRVGHVAYFDLQLGIVESVVRFEGGPTCSVLINLEGSGDQTLVHCVMESIEAAPTPPMAPVIDALMEELARPVRDDAPDAG